VLDEIKGFIKADAAVSVLHADSNPIVLSHRYVQVLHFSIFSLLALVPVTAIVVVVVVVFLFVHCSERSAFRCYTFLSSCSQFFYNNQNSKSHNKVFNLINL
jgi:hypothetical protein